MGREAELEQLHSWLEKALAGQRQVVFITGEPGIGKTTVVDAFLERVAAEENLWIGRGQCLEHYGMGEAYLPVLEALGRLCREPEGKRLIGLLGRYAPTWLVQMPALTEDAALEALQRKVQGATRERMLRELAEAVEVLTTERSLVLVLEDLQWSDHSTLDLISVLAQRRERARLLVIGTYRPVDVIVGRHPLKAVKSALQLHGQCEELRLELLSEADVAEYLAVRFAEGRVPAELARAIHRRTDGNPLFMVNVVDALVRQGVVVEVDGQWQVRGTAQEVGEIVPENLRQLIVQQSERLAAAEQRVLAAASVAGVEFSAAAVAAGLEETVVQVEGCCEELVQREHFLQASGLEEGPEGTVAGRYRFLHALYQEVLSRRVPVGERVRLHRRLGEWEEGAYGSRARERAAELAVHFERGRDYQRAVQYYGQAAQTALQRHAYREMSDLLTKGLELLEILPATPERTQQEIKLQMALGSALSMAKGFADPAVSHAYSRARELCRNPGESPQVFPVLCGLSTFYVARAQLQTARELGEQLFTVTQRGEDPALLVQACARLGLPLYLLGELVLARQYLEQGITLYDFQQHRSLAFSYGQDPGVMSRCYVATTLWCLGYPRQARKQMQEGLCLAQELAHPHTLAYARYAATGLFALYREGRATQEQAEALIALSLQHEFPHWLARGTIYRGWALAARGQIEEGIAQMRQGLAAAQATGAEIWRPYFLALLAEMDGKLGQPEEGLALLAEALATMHEGREQVCEAKLYRLKGQLTRQSRQVENKSRVRSPQSEITSPQHPTPNPSAEVEAEACFLKAIEIARRQRAKSWELRAVMSLSRLWQRQGKKEEARQRLAEIYGWFTEGFDTADLQEARTLLEELS